MCQSTLRPTSLYHNINILWCESLCCLSVYLFSPIVPRVFYTEYIYANFDVLLTAHISIILVINQLNAQNLVL